MVVGQDSHDAVAERQFQFSVVNRYIVHPLVQQPNKGRDGRGISIGIEDPRYACTRDCPFPVDATLVDFAMRVLESAPSVLYGRVDTVMDDEGQPMLVELEVTEPFLFLEHAPEAADRFALAVSRWLSPSTNA